MFGASFERCYTVLSVALSSHAAREPAALRVPWINHYGAHIVIELRRANAWSHGLQALDGRRLFPCFIDNALLPAHLATTQLALQPKCTLSSTINLKTPASSASNLWPLEPIASTSSAEAVYASQASSPTQRALAEKDHATTRARCA